MPRWYLVTDTSLHELFRDKNLGLYGKIASKTPLIRKKTSNFFLIPRKPKDGHLTSGTLYFGLIMKFEMLSVFVIKKKKVKKGEQMVATSMVPTVKHGGGCVGGTVGDLFQTHPAGLPQHQHAIPSSWTYICFSTGQWPQTPSTTIWPFEVTTYWSSRRECQGCA